MFKTQFFSVLFSGDMEYWYENTAVKDVTIRSCTFDHCGCPVMTSCGFKPTKAAPFYHENIRLLNNTVIAPEMPVQLQNVNNVVMRGNTITGLRDAQLPVVLRECSNVTIEE